MDRTACSLSPLTRVRRPQAAPAPLLVGLVLLLALAATPPVRADADAPIFAPGDHCAAYRVTKDMLFRKDVVVVGLSCEVSARIEAPKDGSTARVVVVEVPVKSLDSGNGLRNRSVADILGAKQQPDLRFTSEPYETEALRGKLAGDGFEVAGLLTIAGVDHPVSSRVEVFEHEGRRFVRGRLVTDFSRFGMEPPRAAGGLVARVHEGLELSVQLDLSRVDGLAELTAPRD